MKIKFISNDFEEYTSGTATLYFSGYATLNNTKLKPTDIIEGIETLGESFLEDINGFYAFVYCSKKVSIASVDIIRSIPLFYTFSKEQESLVISDQTCHLLDGHTTNELNKDLFQLSSYVIGNQTLYDEIFQIVAGRFLTIENNRLETRSFYKFDAKEPKQFNVDKFKSDVKFSLKNSFERLIKYANGRQIVVPLSGGYDSRLIASTLKELEYNNIICFSYGVKGNLEAEYSKKIAGSLGYEWMFIEYTPDKWKKAWNSPLAQEFISFASNDSSLPHVQDWLAVKELKDKSLIDDNAIFVPGHCCVTSYITKDIISGTSKRKTLDEICKRHFILAPVSDMNSIKKASNLKDIIIQQMGEDIDFSQTVANNVTIFNWQERQSKYIANSVRVYEFFDYNWWMPLWDKEFTNTWRILPNQLRVDRNIFKEIVNDKYSKASGTKLSIGNAKEPSIGYKLARLILRYSPKKVMDFAKNEYRFRRDYHKHYLCLDSIVNRKYLRLLSKRGYKIIGIYAYYYLNKLWK